MRLTQTGLRGSVKFGARKLDHLAPILDLISDRERTYAWPDKAAL
jgi:hypothetical protein